MEGIENNYCAKSYDPFHLSMSKEEGQTEEH